MITIIYFLDPWLKCIEEQKHTIGSHISIFANTIEKHTDIQLIVMCSSKLKNHIQEMSIALKILPLHIQGKETELERVDIVKRLIKKDPDLIIAYETHAQWLTQCFEKTVVINEQWGAFSRPPFPALTMFDYAGTYQQSILFTDMRKIKKKHLSLKEKKYLNYIRTMSICSLVYTDPLYEYAKKIKSEYKKVILIPLQVDNHISFNGCTNWKNHKVMLEEVLNIIDQDIGVIVTQHPDIKQKILNENEINKLKKKYPNFIYNMDIERIPMVSQWWLLYVDAVLTVSSGLAFQAALFNIPVVALGKSHINVVASTDLFEISNYIKTEQIDFFVEETMWEILCKYNMFLDDYRFNKEKLFFVWNRLIKKNIYNNSENSKEILGRYIKYFRHSILIKILQDQKIIYMGVTQDAKSNLMWKLLKRIDNPILFYHYLKNKKNDLYSNNILNKLPKNRIGIFNVLLIQEILKKLYIYIKKKITLTGNKNE